MGQQVRIASLFETTNLQLDAYVSVLDIVVRIW